MSTNGWSEYDDVLADLEKDDRVGSHDFMVTEIRTFDYEGETIYTINGTLITANNAKATLKYSDPPPRGELTKEKIASWAKGKRRGVLKAIAIRKQLGEFYGKKVSDIKENDVLRVHTERTQFTNKKTGQTGKMTEVMAILPKDQIGKAGQEAGGVPL